MAGSRSEYIAHLNRVLDYIQAHLGEPLPLEVLARVAGFSPFHFHRLFKALAGETLNDYVQRLRLERAANWLLADPARPILEIGLECGFSNPAAFTRAFSAHFGASPSRYRAEGRKNRKVERKPGKDTAPSGGYNELSPRETGPLGRDEPLERSLQMDVEVKTLPSLHVAFIRHISGYAKGEFNRAINECFQRVCGWAAARDLFRPDTLVVGIPYDNPDITPNDRCRYDACVTVPAGAAPSGEVGIQDIPGGKYATVRIDVSTSETHQIGETVDRLYGEWLPASGYQADDKPPLEIYYDTPGVPPGTRILMDYCLPVKPS